jgi:hypothetical protein
MFAGNELRIPFVALFRRFQSFQFTDLDHDLFHDAHPLLSVGLMKELATPLTLICCFHLFQLTDLDHDLFHSPHLLSPESVGSVRMPSRSLETT